MGTEDEELMREVERVRRRNDRRDVQRLIRAVLASPVKDGPVAEVDGERSVESFKKQNTDMQTRILLNTAIDAAAGDAKARDFLFKYAGFEPVKEQTVTVDMPTFIDDMGEPEEMPDGPADIEDLDLFDDGSVR